MNDEIATKLIPLEGDRLDPLRDQKMLMIEVATKSTNGCSVGGSSTLRGGDHFIPPPHIDDDGVIHPSVLRCQIYADNLGAVLSQVRTAVHDDALRQAKEQSDAAREVWLNEDVRASEQRRMRTMPATDGRGGTLLDQHMRLRCPISEWSVLSETTRYRGGLPTLLYCKVVDHEGVAHDLGEYEKHPARFLQDAPPTPKNATRLAAEHQATVIAEAMKSVMGGAPSAEMAELRALVAKQSEQIAALNQRLDERRDKRNDNR